MSEKSEKPDHRKLGRELDLFTFSELVGGGLPLWTPNGTLVRNLLDDFVWELRKKHGYEQVDIPHLTKKDLYIKSGHWDKFEDELFKITTREGHEFAMKPMNCPHHIEIFNRKIWSYRELPVRYANTTKCYRDEQTGELSGISRTRAFTQDDAHVFCRFSQIKEEFFKIWDIVHEFYGAVGFDLDVRLSLHNPDEKEGYLGDSSVWENAENQLREIVKEKGVEAKEQIGEAAFYGPKVDFMAVDSLGREWQVATIQLDMNLPERFDLTCVNENGERERIAMVHAAIMGSIERYLSILIEHVQGALPLWLSPVQVKILPIADPHKSYANETLATLTENGIRADIDEGNETLNKKIRDGKLKKIPYLFVIGDKEIEEKTVTVESRDGKTLGKQTLEEILKLLKKEIDSKA
jgi:threonyl-tRNA synthetase|tara:strand:+ start:30179 stop:31402 length:1224 start_codon:yes stop_codon:yes gene_type:complete